MNHSRKLLFNTIALLIKIIVSCIVQLISTRIALGALGADAFGLYNLLAGVIMLFTFVTGSLLISTQRYLSIALGEKNNKKLKSIFNVSVLIHVLFTVVVVILMIIIKEFLFAEVFNINIAYINTAKRMYDILILSTAITITTVPYSAVINAHEDMVFFAISEIVSLCLKLFAAVMLLFITSNLLIVYTCLMVLAISIGALLKIIWSRIRYEEVKLSLIEMKNISLFKEMIGFVTWNTLGSAAVVARNQGVAVILNIFYGTVINAAYGVASQVNSLVLSMATTLTTVFTPSIIKNKGAGNDKRMLDLAVLSSKLSFFLSSLMALPIIIYIDEILKLWLKVVPEYTNGFINIVIACFLVQQFYPGINRAIYATGKIKTYQIVVSILLISVLPVGYILLLWGYSPYTITIVMLVAQILTLLFTIKYAGEVCNLNKMSFLLNSVLKPLFLWLCVLGAFKLLYIYIDHIGMHNLCSMTVLICIFVLIYILLYVYVILKKEEQLQLFKILKK